MKRFKLISPELFEKQLPTEERQVSGQYNADSIFVYQAYNHSIADAAIQNQRLEGGGFRPGRMTWVKPNFLWMMHRSGWASKSNQERVLAIRISRVFFEELLKNAALSSYNPKVHKNQAAWKQQIQDSTVRVQWDPAYDIYDQRQPYRAVQIGMKGEMAKRYALEEILEILDLTNFSQKTYQAIKNKGIIELPDELIYPTSEIIKQRILAN